MKISLSKIILDKNIEKIVLQYGGNMAKYGHLVRDLGLFGLSEERLDSVLCGIRDKVILPPIDVTEKDGYYYIQNGRHRVASCIIAGMTEIEAKLCK